MKKDNLQPHQQRVVDEHKELKERHSKLWDFIMENPIYLTLPDEEKADLKIQLDAMATYVDVLQRRINRF